MFCGGNTGIGVIYCCFQETFGKVKENGYQIVVRAAWQGMTDSQCHIR